MAIYFWLHLCVCVCVYVCDRKKQTKRDSLLSLSILFSRFVHVVEYIILYYFLMPDNTTLYEQTGHVLFLSSLVDGLLGCFHFFNSYEECCYVYLCINFVWSCLFFLLFCACTLKAVKCFLICLFCGTGD
jgi:hypothetical protein